MTSAIDFVQCLTHEVGCLYMDEAEPLILV